MHFLNSKAMILSIAWKNIWRNKTRSMVILSAIALGLMAGIFSIALMAGMVDDRVRGAIENEVSHMKIHNQKFLENDELQFTINQREKLIETLDTLQQVKAFSERLRMNGMANTSGNNSGVIIYGVHPGQEREVFNIHENIIEETGGFFDEDTRNQIIIGEKLANTLNLVLYEITEKAVDTLRIAGVPEEVLSKLDTLVDQRFRNEEDFREKMEQLFTDGQMRNYYSSFKQATKSFRTRSRIVLTMQDNEGYITGGAFRIAGIYSITNSAFEGMHVFVNYDDLLRITNMPQGSVHEIAVMLDDIEQSDNISEIIESDFDGVSAQIWKELQPDLALTTDYIKISYYVIITFILLALGFGIVNTMLMAVLERIKELGMLMAIGMNKLRIFMMIMLETLFLTLTGAVVGVFLSLLLIAITKQTGIDLTNYAEGFQAIGYSAIVYPLIEGEIFAGIAVLVVLTGILSSVYPAYKALKLNPVEATRTE
jgi:ABC-type lipoprotein release transport system permease subunit